MYEYKIKLQYKVESCSSCPFRRENMFYEDIQSTDKLSGVINITRKSSFCTIKEEPIFVNEIVESYNGKCPLKGNVLSIEDKI